MGLWEKVIFLDRENIKNQKVEIARALREKIDGFVEIEHGNFCNFSQNLCGLCAISSFTLKKVLDRKGIKAKAFIGKFVDDVGKTDHCWVEDNRFIFDITATQFGIPEKVYVIDKKSEKASSYQGGKMIKNANQFNGWPETQRPKDSICHMLIDSLLSKTGD